jgi:hypothetical protein
METFGDGINIAVRLEGLADTGSIPHLTREGLAEAIRLDCGRLGLTGHGCFCFTMLA